MDFQGNAERFVHLDPAHEAHGSTGAPSYPLARSASALAGVRAVGNPAAQPRLNRAGAVKEQFGGCLFERVLVVPQLVNLGTVLTQQQITADVWNTFRNVEQAMTGVNISGTGSGQLPPLVFPVDLAAMQFLAVVITFPTQGDPVIQEAITFEFPGLAGTTLTVTGQRLAVFSVEADWTEGISEKNQIWMTDVIKALCDAEQRVQLRTVPRSMVKFKICASGVPTAFLDNLLSAWQGNLFGVPFWPDKQPLLENVEAGAAALTFDPSDREFEAGGYLVLWRDALTVEVMTVAAVEVGGVTLNGSAQNNWTADGQTWVVPIRRGRLADKVDLSRKNVDVAEMEVSFEIEVV